MVSRILSLLGSCTMLLLLATNAATRTKELAAGTLTLSIFKDASVPAEVLSQAESRAARILFQAGIPVEWLNCQSGGSHVPDQFDQPSPCSSIAYPSHLSVRILSSGKLPRQDIFGEAFANNEGKGTHINIYYGYLQSSLHKVLAEGELLGYVIAHEVGHLLLGTDSHDREGIMQARWEEAQLRDAARGNLQFTPQEAALMRKALLDEKKAKNSVVRLVTEFAL